MNKRCREAEEEIQQEGHRSEACHLDQKGALQRRRQERQEQKGHPALNGRREGECG
jgi:hypothetical protein